MSDNTLELLDEVREIRKLLALLAEPAIAQRDLKLRTQLLEIVGVSKQKQESVHLMDGTRTQRQIRDVTNVNQGNLSTLVGKLAEAKLLTGGTASPALAITIPSNFFETNAKE